MWALPFAVSRNIRAETGHGDTVTVKGGYVPLAGAIKFVVWRDRAFANIARLIDSGEMHLGYLRLSLLPVSGSTATALRLVAEKILNIQRSYQH